MQSLGMQEHVWHFIAPIYFKKTGIKASDAFANWSSFKQAMQKLNGVNFEGKKVVALGYPGKSDSDILHNLAPWIWNAGGPFVFVIVKNLLVDFDIVALIHIRYPIADKPLFRNIHISEALHLIDAVTTFDIHDGCA